MYRIENLGKSFGNKKVLQNINLNIFKGEIFAFMGPSGAGKTTLLRLLDMLEMPTTGKLIFDGNDNAILQKNNVMRRMSMLFQRPAIFNTSVFNNVAYGLEIRKVDKKTIEKKVIDALAIVGLAGCEKQKGLTLSGGEAQRMAFARAIVFKPDVLLLDEPTANLDPANVAKIEDIIRKIRSELGTTIILASHNIYQVRRLADRVGILLNGELIEVNTKEQIFTHPFDERSYAFINGEIIY
ncbi:MAG: phosphate ABC transporter ATP-binding protein [Candidatus Methanoperedens sp.]